MSDDVTIEPGSSVPNGDTSARLLDAIAELTETVREAARRTAALDARIDSLPGPVDIAVAVEAEVERAIRDARDAIDARVASLGAELATMQRRIAEVSDALLPLEGLRTEIATVADQGATLHEARAGVAAAAERLSEVVARIPDIPEAPATDDLRPQLDEKLREFGVTLDELTTTIRSDFELLVRAEQQQTERQIDSLGLRITNLSLSVTKALEDLAAQSQRMSERAGTIEGENAAILSAVKSEVETVARTSAEAVAERTSELDASLADRVTQLEQTMTGAIASLDARVGALPASVESTLAELHASIAAMPDAPGVETALQSLVEAVASSLANVREDLDAVLGRQRETSDAAAERLRVSIEGALATLGAREAQSRAKLAVRLDQISDALGPVVVGVRDVLGGSANRTAAMLDQVRATTGEIAVSMAALDASRAQQSAAIDALSAHLDTRAARLKAAITERTGALESAIAALPRAEDVGDAVGTAVRAVLNESGRAADARMESVEQDLGNVASNVNEIWMRARAIVKALDEQRKATRDDAASATSRMEELAAAENRLVVRMLQIEQRIVASVRALETERDRVFIESLTELAQGLGRRDRKRFRKRMAETPSRQETKVVVPPSPPLQPEPPAPPPKTMPEAKRPPAKKPKPKPKPPAKSPAASEQPREETKTVAEQPRSRQRRGARHAKDSGGEKGSEVPQGRSD